MMKSATFPRREPPSNTSAHILFGGRNGEFESTYFIMLMVLGGGPPAGWAVLLGHAKPIGSEGEKGKD